LIATEARVLTILTALDVSNVSKGISLLPLGKAGYAETESRG
jgi:hypothetical protein